MDFETIKFILPPVIGAVIGLFTNYMAIRMLFRPYKAIKVFGFTLPFTPGVIPKQHLELAEKIGETVGKHLLTTGDIHDLFKSSQIKGKISTALEGMYEQFGMLATFITPDIKDMIAGKVMDMLHTELPGILDELDVKAIVTKKVREFSLQQLEKIILDVARTQLRYVTYFGGVLGFLIGCIQLLLI